MASVENLFGVIFTYRFSLINKIYVRNSEIKDVFKEDVKLSVLLHYTSMVREYC